MILGLDISSTSTGLVALDNNGTVLTALAIQPDPNRKKGLDVISRGIIIAQQIAHDVIQLDPDRIVIEDYGFASQKIVPQAEVKGIVFMCLRQLGRKWNLVSPNGLKKFVGAKEKEAIKLEVFKRWGFEHKSNDVIDAYVLARIGYAMNGFGMMTKYQQEVVEKVLTG